jgi:serpin B
MLPAPAVEPPPSGTLAAVQPKEPPAPPKKSADPEQVRADRPALVKGNTAFALDLYNQLRSKDGNLFLSPYSISTALAMTFAGAAGETEKQMARGMHFGLEQERLHPAFASLLRDLRSDGKKGYQLAVANSFWGQKAVAFREPFLQTLRDDYDSEMQRVDAFDGAAVQAINAWVEKKTQDKIKDLFKPGDLRPETTRLVLVNAIYFKGFWEQPFPKTAAADGVFLVSPEKKVAAPFMFKEGLFKNHKADDFQALELPYKGKDVSMVVLLPNKIDGLAALEKTLTPERLDGVLAKLQPYEVQVTFPKFKVEAEFSLNGTLAAMGMPSLFEGADLSRMSDRPLVISRVVHKAVVDVNEEGTEAAAATGVSGDEGEPVKFRADHPFLFLIRDNRSGSVLFLGRLTNPRP